MKPPSEAASIKFGLLSIWIHGRQFPHAVDYWDGNWLMITAQCKGNQSSVATGGSILHLGELKSWVEALEKMYGALSGEALLPTIEPNLSVKSVCDKMGHINTTVNISSDHLAEKHEFQFQLDQSYLPQSIAQIRAVLTEYKIREE